MRAFAPKFALCAALVAVTALSACKEDAPTCTPELAQQKVQELTTLAQSVATTNPQKLTEITPKLTEIQTQLSASPNDAQAACKALDDLIAALK